MKKTTINSFTDLQIVVAAFCGVARYVRSAALPKRDGGIFPGLANTI